MPGRRDASWAVVSTADGSTSVLVLEAGGPDDAPEVRTPALATALFGTTGWD